MPEELKTNSALLEALKSASTPTAAEVERQRISYIMGTLKTTSPITRAEVEEILAQHEGKKAS